MFQSLSVPLQDSIRFLQPPLPVFLTVLLAVNLPVKAGIRTYRVSCK